MMRTTARSEKKALSFVAGTLMKPENSVRLPSKETIADNSEPRQIFSLPLPSSSPQKESQSTWTHADPALMHRSKCEQCGATPERSRCFAGIFAASFTKISAVRGRSNRLATDTVR